MKYLIILTIFFASLKCNAQTCNATGASINSALQTIKNIKTDFGAFGDGWHDDNQAFNDAAAYIQSNSGNVKLIIPPGLYIVGKQVSHVGHASYDSTVYLGSDIMSFHDIGNVSIQGSPFTQIIFRDSLHFGTFDPATGLPPSSINYYNPYFTNNADYTNAALTGCFLFLLNCENFEVKDLEINGNSGNYIFGGNWGDGPRPIELNHCYGFFLGIVKNSTFSNLHIHHFGVDNIIAEGPLTDADTSLISGNENLIFDSVHCEFGGRNNFSWCQGKNICVLNSSFNNAASQTAQTKPGFGMNIEPEGDSAHVFCTYGYFFNNTYMNNFGYGLTTGASIDNPTHMVGDPYPGYTYNHYFKQCKIVGNRWTALGQFINRTTFDSCRIYGNILNYGSSTNSSIPPVLYINSTFSDCYNGKPMYDPDILFGAETSYRLHIDHCIFNKFYHQTSGGYGWMYFHEGGAICTDTVNMPLIENSIFNCYMQPNSFLVYASNSRNTRFSNNVFNKTSSDSIRWSNSPRCQSDGGEGNVDLGNGFDYHYWPDNYVYPDCEDRISCEENIYLSLPDSAAQNFRSNSFIVSNAKNVLDDKNVLYKAADYIELNPGFETSLTGSSEMELTIGDCDISPVDYKMSHPVPPADSRPPMISLKTNAAKSFSIRSENRFQYLKPYLNSR